MNQPAAPDALNKLMEITDVLLGPDGCPWDRSREPEDVKTDLVEETYELKEAIDTDDPELIEEELGDVLYQVVFLTALYRDQHEITLGSVIQRIGEKLVRRHPHVFEDASAETSEEGVSQWEKAKRAERREEDTEESVVLSGVPDHLPALLRSYRLTQKASTAGFDWNRKSPALDKVKEELDELEVEVEQEREDRVEEELGDLLFACANLARTFDRDPEEVLQQGNDKFLSRFRRMEQRLRENGRDIDDADRDELLALWNDVRETDE